MVAYYSSNKNLMGLLQSLEGPQASWSGPLGASQKAVSSARSVRRTRLGGVDPKQGSLKEDPDTFLTQPNHPWGLPFPKASSFSCWEDHRRSEEEDSTVQENTERRAHVLSSFTPKY